MSADAPNQPDVERAAGEIRYQTQRNDLETINRSFSFWLRYGSLFVIPVCAIPGLVVAFILNAPWVLFGGSAFIILLVARQFTRHGKVMSQIDWQQFQPVTIRVEPDFFITESTHEKVIRCWNGMHSCKKLAGDILLSLGKSYRMLIPQRAFDNEAHVDSTFHQIQDRIKSAHLAESFPEAPQQIEEPLPASVSFQRTRWELMQTQNKYSAIEPQPLNFVWSFIFIFVPALFAFLGGILYQFLLIPLRIVRKRWRLASC